MGAKGETSVGRAELTASAYGSNATAPVPFAEMCPFETDVGRFGSGGSNAVSGVDTDRIEAVSLVPVDASESERPILDLIDLRPRRVHPLSFAGGLCRLAFSDRGVVDGSDGDGVLGAGKDCGDALGGNGMALESGEGGLRSCEGGIGIG